MPRQVTEFSIDEQKAIAEVVLSQLMTLVHRDFTTDPSGYNISKGQLGKLSARVMDNIDRGGLQPSKVVVKL